MSNVKIDVDQRLPVWKALSDLYVDVDLEPEDLQRIAQVLAASSYTVKELDNILHNEVDPVVGANLLYPVGENIGFDPKWLVDNIMKHQMGWLERIVRFFDRQAFGCIREDYLEVLRLVARYRSA